MNLRTMKSMKGTKREFSELSHWIIGCAIEVHRIVGPGLLESTYQQWLAHELKLNGIGFTLEHPLPVAYKPAVPSPLPLSPGRGWPQAG